MNPAHPVWLAGKISPQSQENLSMRVTAKFLFVILLSALLFSTAAAADEKTWSPEDIILAERAGSMEISPDGQWAVWIKSQMDKDKGRQISNLFLSSLTKDKEIQLTRGKDYYSNPSWSPDGSRIAFTSTRTPSDTGDSEPMSRVWLIDKDGGEPYVAFKLDRGINSYRWKDDKTIVFAAEEEASLYAQEIKGKKDTSRIIEDAEHTPPVRLFQVCLDSGKVTRVTRNTDWIRSIDVSPDGKWAAAIHQRSLRFAFDHEVTPSLFVYNLETMEATEIEKDKRVAFAGIKWGKDSKGLYYAREYSSHPVYFTAAITLLKYYDLDSSNSMDVPLDWENGIGGYGMNMALTDDGFICLLADGVRLEPSRYVKSGNTWTRQSIEGTHAENIFGLSLGSDGRTLAYNYSTASTPSQWYQAKLDGITISDEKQLTNINPSYKGKTIFKSEIISWKGANDDTVEGILYYPKDYEEGKKYPLMLSIHGGPAGADMDAWSESYVSPKVILSEKGAFVLKVNYHGSSNYGLEWVESIGNGKYYDLEPVDIEKGVDYLIEKGLVDPEKLGTMGWSNGSILSTSLITRSNRFKVASCGAGDVEWISDWGNVMFGASFDNYYFGGPPYEMPDLYIEKSPYFKLKDVTTPTIIYTGTDDVNVPPSQSWSHFRVMQQATDTPVRFVVFPGEPHGLRKYQHQLRKLNEDLKWFDTHLFKTYEPENEALKENSPLDLALKLKEASCDNGLFGARVNEKLVPETVKNGDLEIGRFEVTRAQYKEFDSGYEFPHGTENYPASGITFEKAKAYASWLSELTGETYRIADEAEVSGLYKARGGNTLDYWAGYSPNPDDAELLGEKISKLGEGVSLLKPVGKFTGKKGVFDLGGNVAEWASDEEGNGVLLGGSADLPSQTEGECQAGEAYRGLRIVKGEKKEKEE